MGDSSHSLMSAKHLEARASGNQSLNACHVLSIDVDDLLTANADFFDESLPGQHRNRIADDILATLGALQASDAKATFFVNARYFDQDAEILKEISACGHTIASHGFMHRNVTLLTLEEFERDLCESLRILSKVQTPVIGYRPPAFSMPYDEQHFRILRANGIRYISSGIGVARSNAPRVDEPVLVHDDLVHVPISTLRLLGGRVKYPIGYGVASRLLPEGLYLWTMRAWLRRRRFFHYYCHSFEVAGLDPEVRVPFRGAAASISTRIYALRCRERAEYFKRIFTAARFGSIETRLFEDGEV